MLWRRASFSENFSISLNISALLTSLSFMHSYKHEHLVNDLGRNHPTSLT